MFPKSYTKIAYRFLLLGSVDISFLVIVVVHFGIQSVKVSISKGRSKN